MTNLLCKKYRIFLLFRDWTATRTIRKSLKSRDLSALWQWMKIITKADRQADARRLISCCWKASHIKWLSIRINVILVSPRWEALKTKKKGGWSLVVGPNPRNNAQCTGGSHWSPVCTGASFVLPGFNNLRLHQTLDAFWEKVFKSCKLLVRALRARFVLPGFDNLQIDTTGKDINLQMTRSVMMMMQQIICFMNH